MGFLFGRSFDITTCPLFCVPSSQTCLFFFCLLPLKVLLASLVYVFFLLTDEEHKDEL
jgi:hypothetical protein